MRPDNGTLAEHPDLFEYVRSGPRTIGLWIVTAICLVGFVLTVVFFPQIHAEMMTYTGRRSAFRALAAPLFVVVAAFFTGSFGWMAVTSGIWRRRDGRALKVKRWPLGGDVNELYGRLATGDPAQYMPVPVARQSTAALRAYRVEGESTTYLTLTNGSGKKEVHWPLLTLTGPAHEAFERNRSRLARKRHR